MQVLWLASTDPLRWKGFLTIDLQKKNRFLASENFAAHYTWSHTFLLSLFQISFVVISSLLLKYLFQPGHVASEICFGLGRAPFNEISWSPFMYHRWQSFKHRRENLLSDFLSVHMLKISKGAKAAKWWNFCYWIIPIKN